MNARALLPLLAVLCAGALVVFLLFADSFGGALDGDAAERDALMADAGGPLGPGGVALDASGTAPRKRAELIEAPPEEAGPKKPTFPPSEGVSGRVVDAKRRPIEGAAVTLHPFPLE